MQHPKRRFGEAGPDAARIFELAFIVITEQQRAYGAARAFGICPADDDELGPVEAFALDPDAPIAGRILRVDLLRNNPFKAELARGLAHRLAGIVVVFAVGNAWWWLPEDFRQPGFALKQRQAGNGRAVERQKVEREIDQRASACVAGGLHQGK